MQKSVITFNDELGTLALGFSKAGYDVKAICLENEDKENYIVCKENWGNIVKYVEYEKDWQELSDYRGIDCLAGRIKFRKEYSCNGGNNHCQVTDLFRSIEDIRPKSFVMQCNGLNKTSDVYDELRKHIENMEYYVRIEHFNTRYITGYPVKENVSFIIGATDFDDVKFDLLTNGDAPIYSIEELLEKKEVEDIWYYRVNEKDLMRLEQGGTGRLLCWYQNHYRNEEFISWNTVKIPLIVQGKFIRKITHREIARIKGIPDEYILPLNNKYLLYRKLMYCTNVRLIQQLAFSMGLYNDEDEYLSRKATRSMRFEKLLFSLFDQKQIKNEAREDIYIDFLYKRDIETFGFEFKIYSNNTDIRKKLIIASKKFNAISGLKEAKKILIVGNIVGENIKEYIEKSLNVTIWDIENLLWILEEFPQLKNEFISLLSYNVSQISPRKPQYDYIFTYNKDSEVVDWQERLRKVRSGKSDARKYELICEDIIKHLFAENIELFKTQKLSNNGLYRFDYCGKIKHGNSSEFFDTIQKFFGTKYIIFEFKNYKEEISQKEIYSTEKYLYEKALRKVAIIFSRKGLDKSAEKASRGSLREMGKLIICLSDEDVNKLIDMKNNNEEPADYLEDILDNMLMDLEK